MNKQNQLVCLALNELHGSKYIILSVIFPVFTVEEKCGSRIKMIYHLLISKEL